VYKKRVNWVQSAAKIMECVASFLTADALSIRVETYAYLIKVKFQVKSTYHYKHIKIFVLKCT
jgi:hypothetical protein